MNKNLEEQAQAIFKSWFVDFEPFNGNIPPDWKEYKLSEFLPVITGKKNANVSSISGLYPFFSCSQNLSWTDDYSFEGSAILVAGNGDFNAKFYNGKFEAYQRTYVLIPYNEKYTAWLYYAIKQNLKKITLAARGSVIKFITKGNLENFSFYAPRDLDNFYIIDNFDATNNIIASNREENIRLSMLRDTLLPKLMTGELDVSNINL
ncbi:restriction endonuclease subunit S [Gardnerella pickettii]|uniref:restriction endonuclease subunit S n=1 Tax=Gardnerella pickettii TaxID=2914924 RepID=UPI000C7E1E7F|nr:type I R-M system S protein [Gardnerella pickettii]